LKIGFASRLAGRGATQENKSGSVVPRNHAAAFVLPERRTTMALTSASSYSDAIDQYLDNLSWDGDLTKARAMLEAIRFLRLQRPTRSAHEDGRSIDYESLATEQQRLEQYLAAVDTTNRPRASFVQGRAIETC
jgi:hypothetical protein